MLKPAYTDYACTSTYVDIDIDLDTLNGAEKDIVFRSHAHRHTVSRVEHMGIDVDMRHGHMWTLTWA